MGKIEGNSITTFKRITKISQAGEGNDLLDVAEDIISNNSDLYSKVRDRLIGLRSDHEKSENIDVTRNELNQLTHMLETAMNHNNLNRRVDLIVFVLQNFISHQQREFSEERKLIPAQVNEFIERASPIFEESRIGRHFDAWLDGESDFIFILIPQKHKDPRNKSGATPEVERIQHKQIMPILGHLANLGICNIVANEGDKLINGPISLARVKEDLDIMSSPDDGAFLAEMAFPKLDTFGIEEPDYNVGDILNPSISTIALLDGLIALYSTEEGKTKLDNLTAENDLKTHDEILDILMINIKSRSEVKRYFKDRGVVDPSVFNDYIDFIMNISQEDVTTDFDNRALIKRNRSIIKNLLQVQKNTNTNCVSLVLGSGHFDELSEKGGESIQRILRKKGISYVTLVPYSVDMEKYDFVID